MIVLFVEGVVCYHVSVAISYEKIGPEVCHFPQEWIDPAREVEVLERERTELRDPHAGLQEDLQDGKVARVGGGCGEQGAILNVNADTAAGEIAAALGAESLVLITDVGGVLDSSRRVLPRLTERQARGLMRSRVVDGGMVPKLEACITALSEVREAHIIDGRMPRALLDVLAGKKMGTRVG